jgi:hypothetical protein
MDFGIPNSVPILLGAEPHNAMLVRAAAALLLIVFIVYLIAMRPFRSFFSNITNKIRGTDKRS